MLFESVRKHILALNVIRHVTPKQYENKQQLNDI